MIDLRYHVYTIVGIFFALALGIVIGASFSGMSAGSKTERKTIARYAESMRTLKEQIEKTSKDIEQNERVIRDYDKQFAAMQPEILADKLLGRRVAIVQTGDYYQSVEDAKKALEFAGARVSSVTELSRTFNYTNDVGIAKALMRAHISFDIDQQEPLDRLMQFLANAIYEGRPHDVLAALEEQKVVKFRGDYSNSNSLVLIVGGADSEKSDSSLQIDIPLISHLNRPNLTVVACEPYGCSVSYVPIWHKQGIASVDNSDWATGQINIVYALLGEKARFGAKGTSDQTITERLRKYD